MSVPRGFGALALVTVVAIANAQSAALTAKWTAKLYELDRFAGKYELSGTWNGSPIAGTLEVKRAGDGKSYDLLITGGQGRTLRRASMSVGINTDLSGLASTGSLLQHPSRGTSTISGKTWESRLESPDGVVHLVVKLTDHLGISVNTDAENPLQLSLVGKRR